MELSHVLSYMLVLYPCPFTLWKSVGEAFVPAAWCGILYNQWPSSRIQGFVCVTPMVSCKIYFFSLLYLQKDDNILILNEIRLKNYAQRWVNTNPIIWDWRLDFALSSCSSQFVVLKLISQVVISGWRTLQVLVTTFLYSSDICIFFVVPVSCCFK
jgi:hypothetical protein